MHDPYEQGSDFASLVMTLASSFIRTVSNTISMLLRDSIRVPGMVNGCPASLHPWLQSVEPRCFLETLTQEIDRLLVDGEDHRDHGQHGVQRE